MRPRSWFVVFANGHALAVVQGHEEARRLAPGRAYRSFTSQLEAEEFAAWWNYQSTRPGGHLYHLVSTRTSSPSKGRTA